MISYTKMTTDLNFIFNKITCIYRMASGSGGRDPAWRYCAPLEGHKNGTICNYCGLSIKSVGITRLKFHLSHTDPHSNFKKCPNVPSEVKQEMKQLLEHKGKAKAKKQLIWEKFELNYETQWEENITISLMMMRRMVMRICICIRLTCTSMSEMNIEKQYVNQKLVNETEIRLQDL